MKSKGKFMLWFAAILLVLSFVFLYLPYRRDIRNAYAKLDSIERQVIETECGPIEVAMQGEGETVLVSHGIGGGFDQGLGLAEAYLGDGYKVIEPSRFGYHGTPLPASASPANQADAFVCVIGFARHPTSDRDGKLGGRHIRYSIGAASPRTHQGADVRLHGGAIGG